MEISIHDAAAATGQAAARSAAGLLREAIARKGKAAFVAATGSSQFDFLEHLVAAPGVDWTKTTMFHLDEYVGLSADHPASFRRYLRDKLTGKVPIGTVHFIHGDAPDLRQHVLDLNRAIAAADIDVAFIGIGENGHLAFNDPPADFDTECPYIVVLLEEACRRQQVNEGWFASLDDVNTLAISMSINQIMKAASIVCTVPGRRKAAAVKACLEGEIDPMHPASVLRRHPNCRLFLDRESASLLSDAARRSSP